MEVGRVADDRWKIKNIELRIAGRRTPDPSSLSFLKLSVYA